MDCEKFEAVMMDELYGELDELTSAAAQRHVTGCARCSGRMGALRATRRVANVPPIEPPEDVEERALAAAGRAWPSPSRRFGVGRAISLAGSWAMRPQTAMAAVFLVMIGTSLLLLRVKSRAPLSAAVTVTEQGTPAPAVSVVAQMAPPVPLWPSAPAALLENRTGAAWGTPGKSAPWPTPLPPVADGGGAAPRSPGDSKGTATSPEEASGGSQFDAALRSYQAGRYDEAARAFDALANPGPPDANTELWAARAVREGQGCGAAVGRFDKTAREAKQTPPGWDALLEGGLCYRQLGDFAAARARLSALLGVDSHKDRARMELDRTDQLRQAQAVTDAKALPKVKHAAAPASPAASADSSR
jgi:TolA-binding protein